MTARAFLPRTDLARARIRIRDPESRRCGAQLDGAFRAGTASKRVPCRRYLTRVGHLLVRREAESSGSWKIKAARGTDSIGRGRTWIARAARRTRTRYSEQAAGARRLGQRLCRAPWPGTCCRRRAFAESGAAWKHCFAHAVEGPQEALMPLALSRDRGPSSNFVRKTEQAFPGSLPKSEIQRF